MVVAQPAAAAAAQLTHSRDKNKNKNKAQVALPVCAAGASKATTTYSCNAYGQNVCAIAKAPPCSLATNADLAKVAARTDCDFLSSPPDSADGGCGLVTREELSEFQSEVVDVTTALANENAVMQATIAAIAAALTQMSSQLPANPVITPPPSPNILCTRQLTFNNVDKNPPFTTSGYTNFQVVPLNGVPIACPSATDLAAFAAVVTTEAAKPDSCPLVPKPNPPGGEYAKVTPRDISCVDAGPSYGLPPGKSLWFSVTLSWNTRFPCPASPLGRITAGTAPGTPIFGLDGCDWSKGCNPCRPPTTTAQGVGPSAQAICQAIYSAYPANTVQVMASYTYLLRESSCEACVAAGESYCSPDGGDPYRA